MPDTPHDPDSRSDRSTGSVGSDNRPEPQSPSSASGAALGGNDDPYGDIKIYHMAARMNQRGQVSPLCADKPRALKLGRHLWTLRPEAVTCPKCLKRLKAKSNA